MQVCVIQKTVGKNKNKIAQELKYTDIICCGARQILGFESSMEINRYRLLLPFCPV